MKNCKTYVVFQLTFTALLIALAFWRVSTARAQQDTNTPPAEAEVPGDPAALVELLSHPIPLSGSPTNTVINTNGAAASIPFVRGTSTYKLINTNTAPVLLQSDVGFDRATFTNLTIFMPDGLPVRITGYTSALVTNVMETGTKAEVVGAVNPKRISPEYVVSAPPQALRRVETLIARRYTFSLDAKGEHKLVFDEPVSSTVEVYSLAVLVWERVKQGTNNVSKP